MSANPTASVTATMQHVDSSAMEPFGASRLESLDRIPSTMRSEVTRLVMHYASCKLMLTNGLFTMEESPEGGFRGEVYNTRWHSISEGSLGV